MRLLLAVLVAVFCAIPLVGHSGLTVTSLGAMNHTGYSVPLTASNPIGFYKVEKSFPFAIVGFEQGSTFAGNLYACEGTTYSADTCDLVTAITGDLQPIEYQTTRLWYVLEVTTAETSGFTARLVIRGSQEQISGADPFNVNPGDESSTSLGLQEAIDQYCKDTGNGTVSMPPGDYILDLTGESDAELRLPNIALGADDAGCTVDLGKADITVNYTSNTADGTANSTASSNDMVVLQIANTSDVTVKGGKISLVNRCNLDDLDVIPASPTYELCDGRNLRLWEVFDNTGFTRFEGVDFGVGTIGGGLVSNNWKTTLWANEVEGFRVTNSRITTGNTGVAVNASDDPIVQHTQFDLAPDIATYGPTGEPGETGGAVPTLFTGHGHRAFSIGGRAVADGGPSHGGSFSDNWMDGSDWPDAIEFNGAPNRNQYRANFIQISLSQDELSSNDLHFGGDFSRNRIVNLGRGGNRNRFFYCRGCQSATMTDNYYEFVGPVADVETFLTFLYLNPSTGDVDFGHNRDNYIADNTIIGIPRTSTTACAIRIDEAHDEPHGVDSQENNTFSGNMIYTTDGSFGFCGDQSLPDGRGISYAMDDYVSGNTGVSSSPTVAWGAATRSIDSPESVAPYATPRNLRPALLHPDAYHTTISGDQAEVLKWVGVDVTTSFGLGGTYAVGGTTATTICPPADMTFTIGAGTGALGQAITSSTAGSVVTILTLDDTGVNASAISETGTWALTACP